MASGLWEGARRLPYFFTFPAEDAVTDAIKDWIFCPQCALEHVNTDLLTPHYTTLRSVMCGRCGIVMGPINKAEMEATDE